MSSLSLLSHLLLLSPVDVKVAWPKKEKKKKEEEERKKKILWHHSRFYKHHSRYFSYDTVHCQSTNHFNLIMKHRTSCPPPSNHPLSEPEAFVPFHDGHEQFLF